MDNEAVHAAWERGKARVTDDQVLRIMKDGGRKLCDYALEQWTGWKYASDPPTSEDEIVRQEYIAEWKEVKSRISEVAHKLCQVKNSNYKQDHTAPPS